MNIESINIDGITDLDSAKAVISQLAECVFVLKRDIQRQLDNLSSRNVKTLDMNITKVTNSKYITKEYADSRYQQISQA